MPPLQHTCSKLPYLLCTVTVYLDHLGVLFSHNCCRWARISHLINVSVHGHPNSSRLPGSVLPMSIWHYNYRHLWPCIQLLPFWQWLSFGGRVVSLCQVKHLVKPLHTFSMFPKSVYYYSYWCKWLIVIIPGRDWYILHSCIQRPLCSTMTTSFQERQSI